MPINIITLAFAISFLWRFVFARAIKVSFYAEMTQQQYNACSSTLCLVQNINKSAVSQSIFLLSSHSFVHEGTYMTVKLYDFWFYFGNSTPSSFEQEHLRRWNRSDPLYLTLFLQKQAQPAVINIPRMLNWRRNSRAGESDQNRNQQKRKKNSKNPPWNLPQWRSQEEEPLENY